MDPLQITKELIRKKSVTPKDEGCIEYCEKLLKDIGFNTEILEFENIKNLWAYKGDLTKPFLIFAGHTDVVPSGPEDYWSSKNPFEAYIKDDYLIGRGANDMKGGLASMLAAAKTFYDDSTNQDFNLGFVITGDEEQDAINGTVKVLEVLSKRNIEFPHCVIGEPSSQESLGDTIHIGRRGSMSATLKIKGIQGHVGYHQKARNPIHTSLPILSELVNTSWDNGTVDFDTPTGFQVTNIKAGTGAGNVIPPEIIINFNFRFSKAFRSDELKAKVKDVIEKTTKNYEISWQVFGEAFLSEKSLLSKAAESAVNKILNIQPSFRTDGGTSDGRFFALYDCEVLELGHLNTNMHGIDEMVKIQDLHKLQQVYHQILINIKKASG